jgi:hypothetical protein
MPADPGISASRRVLSEKLSASDCLRLIETVTDDPASALPLRTLKDELVQGGIPFVQDEFERTVLGLAAAVTQPRIGACPVHISVQNRLREEFRFYTEPTGKDLFDAGSYLFATGCKVISLRRFPAGPMDWEISGIPLSWLLHVPKADLPRTALFIASRLRGLYPFFFMHVARKPKNRSLLIEKEVLRSYYLMARSLELQPSMKGIMASSWFHDPAAVAANPHLACLNKLYLEEGGLITTVGDAPDDAGFLEHNARRKEQLEAGTLRYKTGLALWPRRQAIAWAASHPELEP